MENFLRIFTVEILLEWMESFKRGKLVLRKLGRSETRYLSRSSYKLKLETRGQAKGRNCKEGIMTQNKIKFYSKIKLALVRPVMLVWTVQQSSFRFDL